ncbi:MAG TPA: hypothetical protein VGJ14_18090 [Sporichthyaceae bacterium]
MPSIRTLLRIRAVPPALALTLTTAGVVTFAPRAGADGVCTTNAGLTTCVFRTAAGAQPFLVPPGVVSLTVKVVGAAGGSGSGDTTGGGGGTTTGTLTVTPTSTLDVYVGGGGGNAPAPPSEAPAPSVHTLRATCTAVTGGSAGIGGGGSGGSGCAGGGGGGGGGSFVMTHGSAPGTPDQTLAAAGGGGGGAGQGASLEVVTRGFATSSVDGRTVPAAAHRISANPNDGGAGGYVSGGTNHPGGNGGGSYGGHSGDTGGGAGGAGATAGSAGVGGNGANASYGNAGGGGGGGGYVGGGGGGKNSGGGGGCGFLQGVPTSCTAPDSDESVARPYRATATGADGEVDLSYPTPPTNPPPNPNRPGNPPNDEFPGFPPDGGGGNNNTPSNVSCHSGAECTAFAGPGADAAYSITAHGGSGKARLFAKLNSGRRPDCPNYRETVHDFVRFGFRNADDGRTWRKTGRLTVLHRMSHDEALALLHEIQICFAAPYTFVPRRGWHLVHLHGDWIGILPECGTYLDRYAALNHLAAPCVSQRRLLRWHDDWAVRVVFRVPEGRQDPKALG